MSKECPRGQAQDRSRRSRGAPQARTGQSTVTMGGRISQTESVTKRSKLSSFEGKAQGGGLGADDFRFIERRIAQQAARQDFRVTQHAQQEMAEEDILLSDVLEALQKGHVLEHYPEHLRGACCLV